MFRFLILAFTAIGVAGCGTTSIKSDFTFNDTSEGIAVFSVTNDQTSGNQREKAIFYMNGSAYEKNYRQLESTAEAFPGGFMKSSEFSNVKGRLFAISLPSGEHALTSWKISNGTGMYITPKTEPKPLTFHIEKGKIKYLGNFHMNLQTGKNAFGITIIGSGYPEIRDASQRDLVMFEERYPQFKGKVVKAILPVGQWNE